MQTAATPITLADKANALAGASADDVFHLHRQRRQPGGTSDTAELRIAVTGTNDAPVAANDSGTVAEDATLTVSAANGVICPEPGWPDTDVDGGPSPSAPSAPAQNRQRHPPAYGGGPSPAPYGTSP